jgi:hypothetical protein
MSNVDVKFRLKQRKLKETLFREGGMSTENVLITMRVHYLNMRLEFSTGYHADVACWDPESECVTCANRDGLSADEINGGLMRLTRNIKSAAKLRHQFYSQRRVREFLMGGNGMNSEMGMPPGGFGGHGSRQKDIKYSGATSLTTAATETGKAYESTKTDESALMISTKGAVTVSQPTISKTGDSDGGDNCSFYGVNAALLVKGGSTTTIKGGTISSSATGANGVFSYGGNGDRNGADGDGTTVIIEDTKITTTGNGSGGIMTTGGGVMKAKNLTVNTSGRSSAPIRSDRGGGIVTVEGGCYTSSGQGSPVIYSTADITVSNAVLTSTMSEGAVIEGKNSITLNNCQMTVSNTRRNSHAQFLDGIMLFQSFSGDAARTTGTA